MNGITRNLVVVVLVAVSSIATAAALLFGELHFGRSLYGYMVWSYVPAGVIGAGVLAAALYYAGSRLLRIRPSNLTLIAIVLFAVATVFVVDSLEYGLMATDPKTIADAPAFTAFAAKSISNSPLLAAFAGAASDATSSAASAAGSAASMPSVGGDNNAAVEGIGSGVNGMMQTGNAVSTQNPNGAFGGVAHRVQGLEAFGSGVMTHGMVLELAAVQIVAFLLAGLLAYRHLRSISYCDDCGVFLSKKGEQTRYFTTLRDVQGSIDEFLTMVKSRQFRQSIHAHSEEGSPKKDKLSEYASTVEVSRCKGCQTHRLKFSARRKEGASWKDISMLGYTASCFEQIDVVR